MKRDCLYLAFGVFDLKRKMVPFRKLHLLEGDPKNSLGGVILVADFKAAPSKVMVPADSIQ